MPRLSPLEQLALDRYRAALSTSFGPRLREFVLFGSRARGEGHEESDLDVLVVLDPLDDAARRIAIDLAADVSVDVGLVLSPLVRSPQWRARDLPLVRELERDGVVP